MFLAAVSCGNGSDNTAEDETTPIAAEPTYQEYYIPYTNNTQPDTTPFLSEMSTVDKHTTPEKPTKTKISAAYREGYEKGYDDGEDDCVNHNGWHGQYDPSCRYKGKKRRDYIQGYDEGYEDGYEDSKEEDGRSSDWDDYE